MWPPMSTLDTSSQNSQYDPQFEVLLLFPNTPKDQRSARTNRDQDSVPGPTRIEIENVEDPAMVAKSA